MILEGEYKDDIRVRREAEGLVSKGHSVHVVCSRGSQSQQHESLNSVQITRIGTDSKLTWYLSKGVYLTTWYDPIWLRELHNLLHDDDYDFIYFHDVHHAKLAIRLAKWHNLRTIADLHEIYSFAVDVWQEDYSYKQKLKPGIFLRPAWRFRRMEEYVVTYTDGLVTVSEEILDYYLNKYNKRDLPAKVVRNVPDLDRLDNMPVEPLGYEDEFIISYIGGFSPQKGLEIPIKAMSLIKEKIPQVKLVLVGDGQDEYVQSLHQTALKEGVVDTVEFVGWVDFERVASFYNVSDLTIVPFVDDPESQRALPNKLFQSMAFETPVLSSNLMTMKRILNETEAGITFEHSPESFAETVVRLYNEPSQRCLMGKNGRRAVEQKYNIKKEIDNITQLFDCIEPN